MEAGLRIGGLKTDENTTTKKKGCINWRKYLNLDNASKKFKDWKITIDIGNENEKQNEVRSKNNLEDVQTKN